MRQRPSRPRLLQAMMDAFSLPDLRRRILITFSILVVFRFIAHVPLPGVDLTALRNLFENNALLGMLDLFSGGAMRQFSVASMGVYPYITSSIIIILMVPIIPALQRLSQEGESGRNRINLITHWLTVPLAGLSGYGQLVLLQRSGVVISQDPLPTVTIVISLIAGTMFLVWLGELITEYGIGNGISIIIFGGIVAGYPTLIQQGFLARSNFIGLIVYIVITLVTVVLIVVFTEAHRRIPVQYARSVFRGGRMYRQSGTTHIPMRVNSAGMIPLIFSMSVVIFPGIVASYFVRSGQPGFADTIVRWFTPNTSPGGFYWILYFLLSVAFTFFYTMVTYQQQDLPGTLQKQGGFIPGIRPGKNTASYLGGVINRITWAGALFLAFVAVMPFLAQTITNVQQIQLSSLGMLIVVGVVLDTMKQLEAQLVMRRYEGFIK
ncbi:MAG: preprotein translocase subunit SecY [Chloroflexi bacterium RBG_13_57_8]|nr:MAG: preprotein translocase subunit SecY [Chloroflexi bacterium RBG_13_57_8]